MLFLPARQWLPSQRLLAGGAGKSGLSDSVEESILLGTSLEIGLSAARATGLLLTDGFVHYAEPISPDEFRKSSRFLDAYPQLKSLPSPVRSNVIREICVVPEHATGVLNQHLLPGVPRECGLVYLNYSGKAVEITPYASSDGSVQVVFSEPSFTLAPMNIAKSQLDCKLPGGFPDR